jgi:predicted amidohydrolase
MKVAAVQMDVKILEKGQNLTRILQRMEEAAHVGAKLLVFPECALTGYCFASREEAWPLAETIPGPSAEKLAAAARCTNLSWNRSIAEPAASHHHAQSRR